MDNIFEFDENEVKTENSVGNVKISNDVIAAIASVSAEETKGVAHMYTSIPDAIAEKLGSKKNQSKGVKVVINEKGILLDVYLVIDYGVRIRDVAESVQESVKENVETMTGLSVIEVNIRVEGVEFKNTAVAVEEEPFDEF